MQKLEIERRWLVKPSFSKEAWANIKRDSMLYYITQDYLRPDGDTIRRIRYQAWLENSDLKTLCMYTTKKKVEKGVATEDESFLSMEEYLKLIREIDPATKSIFKERYAFSRNGWGDSWELDIFKGRHEGLVILEAELRDINEPVTPPSYLEIVKEVTGDDEYSNYTLAHK